MKCSSLFALILAACQGGPPGSAQGRPAQALDPMDPKSVAEHAAYNTRTQQSYQTKFKASLKPPEGDRLDYEGTCVWVSPGVLYIHYTASGGEDRNVIRAGDRVWVYHSLAGWVTAEEAAMPGAARGIQNPDEVLSVLARHAGGAKLRQPGVVDMTFSGEDIEKIMKEQSQQGAFDWKRSSAAVELHVGAETRLKKFVCQATLKAADPKIKGAVGYSAEVEVVAFNGARDLKFQDEKKREIKLTKAMLEAIDKVQKEKR